MAAMTLGSFGFTVDMEPHGDGHLASAADIERLGFTTLWIAGGQLDRLDRLADLVSATDRVVVGSSIIPPDVYAATEVAALYERVESVAPGRLLVGLGSSQQPRALAALSDYVDQLDAAANPVPQQRRMLAAFGPRALDIARDRFAGAISMLFTPDYTAVARQRLGPGRTLAVGLDVVLDEDPQAARATAREPLTFLSGLPGYRKSFRRQGFTDDDIDTVSDEMIDRLVAWGNPDDIARHAHQLRAAGADHVLLTVLGGSGQPTGLAAARLLAPALG